MVEHNLAKVGVASSTLVFRSIQSLCMFFYFGAARMVELVDTRDLKSLGLLGRAGSIPALGTRYGVVVQKC